MPLKFNVTNVLLLLFFAARNQLTGTIPSNLGSLRNLKYLAMGAFAVTVVVVAVALIV